MIGAFVGDCIGSEFEFPIGQHRNPNAVLFGPTTRYTDDSVCTSAIAQWLLCGQDPDPTEALLSMGNLHLGRGFGGKFVEWLRSSRPQPYGSWGNGSAMRASPVALWALTDDEALDLAARSAAPTHSHPDAVAGAQAIVMAIRWAMAGAPFPDVIAKVEADFGYAIASLDPATLRATSIRRLLRRHGSPCIGLRRQRRLVRRSHAALHFHGRRRRHLGRHRRACRRSPLGHS